MSYSLSYANDLWAEERLPNFRDVFLQPLEEPKDGKLYVMYHGTTVENADSIIKSGFRCSKDGMLGPGVYVSRIFEKAKRYPIGMAGRNVVLKLRVNVGRVKKIDRQGHPLQKSWHSNYDCAWVPPNCGMVHSGLEEECIADPSRIKVIDVALAPSNDIGRLKQLVK